MGILPMLDNAADLLHLGGKATDLTLTEKFLLLKSKDDSQADNKRRPSTASHDF